MATRRASVLSEIVIDASIAAAWLFDDEFDQSTADVMSNISADEGIVPRHWHLEMRNALLMGERRGRVAPEHIAESLNGLNRIHLRTDPEPDLDAAFSLARARGLTIYDAVYLELALRRRAALATLDGRLRRAAAAERVQTLP